MKVNPREVLIYTLLYLFWYVLINLVLRIQGQRMNWSIEAIVFRVIILSLLVYRTRKDLERIR